MTDIVCPDYVYALPSRNKLRVEYGQWWWLAEKLMRRIHLRTVLSERQNHRCAVCGVHTNLVEGSRQRATIEHVLARVRGGQDVPDHCVMTCARCNGKRGDAVLPEEALVRAWMCEAVDGPDDRRSGVPGPGAQTAA